MTKAFRVVRVNTKAEVERYGVAEFAAEFGHEPMGLPILLFFCDDDLVAYVEVRKTPILYAAVHPKTSPRIFLEGGRLLKEVAQKEFEGGFVVYERETSPFGSEVMLRLGFHKSTLEFFEPDQEEPNNGSQSAIDSEI